MVKKSIAIEAKESSFKPGLSCIGELCFNNEEIVVKVPAHSDPECAKAAADLLLQGKKVRFDIETEDKE